MLKNKGQAVVRIVLFARVSTKPQAAEDRYSISAQLTEMREFCARKGWKIVAEIVEVVSGKATIRVKLKELLNLVRAGEVDVVLVHELSRLSRSVYQTLHIFEVLGENSVGFASVKDPDFDFTDPSRRFFLIIMAAINEYYLNLLRLHTSKAKQQRAREGRHNFSVIPFGYARAGGPRQPPVIAADEADLVRQAFEDYASGKFTDVEIAERFNAAGITTHHCHRRFSKDTMADILTNPFYVGKLPYCRRHRATRKVYDGLHAPIISGDLFERCRHVRETRRSGSRAVQKPWRAYLLSKLASCDICGRKLRSQPARSGNYYREASFERGYIDCPNHNRGVRTEVVDRQISLLVMGLELPTDWPKDEPSATENDGLSQHLNQRREKLETEQRRLREMRLHGDYDGALDDYYSELARLRRELEHLPSADRLAEQHQALETLRVLQAEWPEAALARRRDLLRQVLRDVSVDVTNGRVTFISPLPAFIPIFQRIPQLAERQPGIFVPLWSLEQARQLPNTALLQALVEVTLVELAAPFIITSFSTTLC